MNCPNCHTKFVKDARFCHNCGTENVLQIKACAHCETKNPSNAKFCHACGQHMDSKKSTTEKNKHNKKDTEPIIEKYEPQYPINFDRSTEKVTEQIKTHFFQALKKLNESFLVLKKQLGI